MTILAARPNTGLLVIDAQQDVLAAAGGRDTVIANIAALVTRARRAGVPVIWILHSDAELALGSAGWRLVPELAPHDGEPLLNKDYGDSFEATSLETVLAGHGIGRLVVTGAQSDGCIRSTIHGAFARGYDVTLVGDAHTTDDRTADCGLTAAQVIGFTNLYWSWQSAPGRTAATVPAAEVGFGPDAVPA
jgi:nicotinamidase-related amidase